MEPPKSPLKQGDKPSEPAAPNTLVASRAGVINKELAGEMEGDEETASPIGLELPGLSLEINLEKDLLCAKYRNIPNRFFSLLDKKRKIKAAK